MTPIAIFVHSIHGNSGVMPVEIGNGYRFEYKKWVHGGNAFATPEIIITYHNPGIEPLYEVHHDGIDAVIDLVPDTPKLGRKKEWIIRYDRNQEPDVLIERLATLAARILKYGISSLIDNAGNRKVAT
jgi:hypothetical protein